jgi:SAM-dependent methyltransferase
MHQNALAAWKLWQHAAEGRLVLEVGPDVDMSLERSTSAAGCAAARWDTVDIKATHPGVRFVAPGEYDLGLPTETYDLVVSANVMEHVRRPWRWVPELARVLKHGGMMILIAPSTWEYHPSSWFPDCWRFWDSGMSVLLEDAGLVVVVSEHGSWASENDRTVIDVLGVGRKP